MQKTDKAFTRHRYPLILVIILFIGACLRLSCIYLVPTRPVSDYWSYFQRAASLADRGSYEAIPGRPDASYPPGYPLLLSLFFRLPVDRLITAKIVNLGLGVISIALTALLGRQLFGESPSLVAASIMAIYPRSILQTLLIASENLFTPILLAWIFILLPGRNKHPLAYALLGGLLLGALALTRSAAWLLIIPWMLVQVILRPPRKGFFFEILICLSVQVLVLSPWANHNQIVLGTPTFLTTTSGINLFIGNNPNATGYWYPWSLDMRLEHPDFFEHTIVEQNRIAADIALNWISKNPGTAIELDLRKWGMIFKDEHSVLDETISGTQISPPWPPGDVLPGEHPLKALNDLLNEVVDISYWFILGFEVIGIIIAFIGWRSIKLPGSVFDQLFLFLTALYFPTVSALFLANTRFHWPTLDALIPFAAFCLFFLSQMNRWSIHRRTSNE